MHRQLLESCTPALVALGVGFAVLLLLSRIGPVRFDWRRLLELHRCERGGVQSLAFVLVLPIFMTITVFIVQISQILVGMMVVNHASFAGARSASVWIPAHLDDDFEPMNRVALVPSESFDLDQYVMTIGIDESARTNSEKLARIRMAAVMACAGVSPSRSYGLPAPSVRGARALDVARLVYPRLVPSSRENGATDRRIVNKVVYSDHHTFVVVEWRDTRDATVDGPRTYNPRTHPDPEVVFDPSEVGWEDAITVHVVHRYALISGAGRMLAGRLSGWRSLPQRVLRQLPPHWLDAETGDAGQPIVLLSASTTITNEGMKPVRFHDLD